MIYQSINVTSVAMMRSAGRPRHMTHASSCSDDSPKDEDKQQQKGQGKEEDIGTSAHHTMQFDGQHMQTT
jgi:hypothetical protein